MGRAVDGGLLSLLASHHEHIPRADCFLLVVVPPLMSGERSAELSERRDDPPKQAQPMLWHRVKQGHVRCSDNFLSAESSVSRSLALLVGGRER
jgi:hypothetical protein